MRAAVLLIALSGAATADEQLARQHYEKAIVLYNLQHFDMALDKFQGAYVETPDPALLFNIAQCQRQLGRYPEAAKSYRPYLAQLPDAANREEVTARIADMERAAHERRAAMPPTGTVQPSEPLTVVKRRSWYRNPAGMSLAAVGLAGVVAGGALLGQSATLNSDARRASTLPDQQRFTSDAGTFTTAGAVTLAVGGGALVVGAIILGVQR